MAVFPDKIVLKNSTDTHEAIRAAIAPGGTNPIVPGELVVAMDTNGASLYTLTASNSVVQIVGGGINGMSGVTSVNGLGGYVDLPGSRLNDFHYNGDEYYANATILIPGFGRENEATTANWGSEAPLLTPIGDLKCVLAPTNYYGTSSYCNNAAMQVYSNRTNFGTSNFTIEISVYIPDTSRKTVFMYDGVDPAVDTNMIMYYESEELVFQYWDGSTLRTESTDCTIDANTWTLVRLVRRDTNSLFFQVGRWGEDNLYVNNRMAITSGSSVGTRPSATIFVGAELTNGAITDNNPFYFENFRITNGVTRYQFTSAMPSAESYINHGIVQSHADVLAWNEVTGAFEAVTNYGRAIVADLAPAETPDGYPLQEGMTWFDSANGLFYCRYDNLWQEAGGGGGGTLYLDDLLNVDTGSSTQASLIFSFDEADGDTTPIDSLNGVVMSSKIGAPETRATGNIDNPSNGALSIGTIGSAPSGGTDGVYLGIPTSGGTGTGCLASVTVSNGGATLADWKFRANQLGAGYQAGDVLTVSNADLVAAGVAPGDGSDLSVTVDSVLESKFGPSRLWLQDSNATTQISNADAKAYMNVGELDAFTVELWLYSEGGSSSGWLWEFGLTPSSNPSVRGQFGLVADMNTSSDTRLGYKWRTGSGSGNYGTEWMTLPGGGGIARNEWVHIALVRDRSNVELFYNGTSLGVDTSLGNRDIEAITNEAVFMGSGVKGYLDDFRFTHEALYRGDFTPPAVPFSNGPADGSVLVWDSASRTWVAGSSTAGGTLAGLSDVSIPSPSVGDVLSYDGANWVNTAAPPADISGSSIGQLSDVNTIAPSPSDGDALVWNNAAGEWRPGAVSGGGGGGLDNVVEDTSPQLGGDLDVNGHDVTSASSVRLAPTNGELVVKGGSTEGAITLNCTANTHGVTIKSPPHAAAATYTLTLPESTGTAGQVLSTDGAGVLSWADDASGGGGIEEAPQDGLQYARQDAAWTVVQASTVGAAGSFLTDSGEAIGGNLTLSGLGHSGVIRDIAASLDAWVVIYSSAAERTADASRAFDTDPAPGSGVLAEFYLSAGTPVLATPGTTYFNNDTAAQDAIYLAVRNQAGAAVEATVAIAAFGQRTITGINGGTFGSG